MNKLILTRRLLAVAEDVPQNSTFADIGTDHAFLPVWLIQQGRVSHAIAADLRQGPLDHARATAAQYGLTDQFDFRLSDGLQVFAPGEVNCIAIAGMGGEAIRSILSAVPWTRANTRLILQPQSNQPELRRWLTENGYVILRERCVHEENHWYSVLLVQGGRADHCWTHATALTGDPACWKEGCPWQGFVGYHIERLEKQINGLQAAAQRDEARLKELRETIAELETLLNTAEGKDTSWQL